MSTMLMEVTTARQALQAADQMRESMAGSVRTATLSVSVFVVGIVGAAALLPMGSAVTGSGQVQAESLVKQIAHPMGGVISEILVKEGDHVKKGDVLIRFDSTVSGANAEYAGMTVTQLLATRARLEAIQLARPSIVFPDELVNSKDPAATQAMEDQQRLFELDRQKNASMRGQLTQRIAQYQQDIVASRSQMTATNQQYTLIVPERDGLRKLWEKRLVSINRLNQLERTAVELKGQSASLSAQIGQSQARIGEVREQIINLDQTARSDAGTQLMAVNAQLNDQRVRAASASDTFDRSTVRAPYGGVVDKLAFSTVGTFIPPAQQIVEIVPDNDLMEVAVQISPLDIDQVHEGQAARVRFSAFSAPSTPEITGKVVFVSADRAQDPRTGSSYFRARVRLSQADLKRHGAIELKSGMPTEVFITTGSRTMLSYITKPLRDQFARAFLES
ncbi:HlyD family type I secretion periplasmic adaptor subunit [Novosphingobium album (ex Hu et al. 2023)]|uniref:Membrane fusion protein (MFP) family protein n=1 Tax=Novosphingobium album (ex Hu et al. 2023) TaxID=2930093 RepID=A0ABT0B5B9_9SPHN|nr:HlyD family type I secretion periplasmic adaptor subunit [Novosphingobium album (ex Hu et al. 2023)]MCJ2180076.1 HlyD family type I secretion periplasmic adaptor subunit [Novosphingobium album (ex Hu et al. 2023)]